MKITTKVIPITKAETESLGMSDVSKGISNAFLSAFNISIFGVSFCFCFMELVVEDIMIGESDEIGFVVSMILFSVLLFSGIWFRFCSILESILDEFSFDFSSC